MTKLQLLNTAPIYRNPNPGYRHETALFSHIVSLGGDELLCLYNRGEAMYATDLTFWQARSTDGGLTWGEHWAITDRSHDDRPYSYHSPFVSRMSDGQLVIVAFRVDRSDRNGRFSTKQRVALLNSRSSCSGHSITAVLGNHLNLSTSLMTW